MNVIVDYDDEEERQLTSPELQFTKDELAEMAKVEVYMLGSQKSVKNYNGKARPITNGSDKESTHMHTHLAFKSAGALDQSNARRRSVLGEIQNLPKQYKTNGTL